MRKLVLAVCLIFACAPFALAQAPSSAEKQAKEVHKRVQGESPKKEDQQTAQQRRMKQCNEQAGAKKMEGPARKAFMSACLRGETDKKGEPLTAQQSRMKECNKQASDKKMKGDDRKKFMSACLRG